MRSSAYTALVLATVTIGNVLASPVKHGHAHMHAKRDAEVLNVEATVEEKRDPQWNGINFKTVSITYSAGQTWGQPTLPPPAPAAAATPAPASPKKEYEKGNDKVSLVVTEITTILTTENAAYLTKLGFKSAGINAKSSSAGVWLGDDGPYTVKMVNNANEDLIVVCWGPSGSWVNVNKCSITISLPKNSYQTVSFANGEIGACAAIYSDTELVNGQISNTWFEYSFSNIGVVDVSREVNMNGHGVSVVGPKCTTNMDTCVFQCNSGDNCMTDYKLNNCAPGSQPGAQYGTYEGADSGGCGGLGDSATLVATFT